MIANSQTSMQVRANLAATHLQSAGVAARKAHEIEQNNSTKQFGDWYSEMMQLVPVSIVMAGAALEAGANERLRCGAEPAITCRRAPATNTLAFGYKTTRPVSCSRMPCKQGDESLPIQWIPEALICPERMSIPSFSSL
jgi:hypothetical protein